MNGGYSYRQHGSSIAFRATVLVTLAAVLSLTVVCLTPSLMKALEPPPARKWESPLVISAMQSTAAGLKLWIRNQTSADYFMADPRAYTVMSVADLGLEPLPDAAIQVPVFIPAYTCVAVLLSTSTRPSRIVVFDTTNKYRIAADTTARR